MQLRLPDEELQKFAALCAREGLEPDAVLRDMVRLYLACDGSLPDAAAMEDLDRFLDGFLDWYLDHAAPAPDAR